jgi:hypothetical protein
MASPLALEALGPAYINVNLLSFLRDLRSFLIGPSLVTAIIFDFSK